MGGTPAGTELWLPVQHCPMQARRGGGGSEGQRPVQHCQSGAQDSTSDSQLGLPFCSLCYGTGAATGHWGLGYGPSHCVTLCRFSFLGVLVPTQRALGQCWALGKPRVLIGDWAQPGACCHPVMKMGTAGLGLDDLSAGGRQVFPACLQGSGEGRDSPPCIQGGTWDGSVLFYFLIFVFLRQRLLCSSGWP